MKDFLIITNVGLIKVVFEESINGRVIKYEGSVYDLNEISAQETTQELQYAFSFSRLVKTWDTINDFVLESKIEQVQKTRDAIQEIIVSGIREYGM